MYTLRLMWEVQLPEEVGLRVGLKIGQEVACDIQSYSGASLKLVSKLSEVGER